MYSFHNRDDLEKLKKVARIKISTLPRKIETETWEARHSL